MFQLCTNELAQGTVFDIVVHVTHTAVVIDPLEKYYKYTN